MAVRDPFKSDTSNKKSAPAPAKVAASGGKVSDPFASGAKKKSGFMSHVPKPITGLLGAVGSTLGMPQQVMYKAGQGLGDILQGHTGQGLGGLAGAFGEIASLGQAGGDIGISEALGEIDADGKRVPKKLARGLETGINVVADPLNFVVLGAGTAAKSASKTAAKVLPAEAAERLAKQGFKKGLNETEQTAVREAIEAGAQHAKNPVKTAEKQIEALSLRGRGGVTARIPGTQIGGTVLSGEKVGKGASKVHLTQAVDSVKKSKLGQSFGAKFTPGSAVAQATGSVRASEELLDALGARGAREASDVEDLVTRWNAGVADFEQTAGKKFGEAEDTIVYRALESGDLEAAKAANPELARLIDMSDALRTQTDTGLRDAGVLADGQGRDLDTFAHRTLDPDARKALDKGERDAVFEGRGVSGAMNPGSAKARVVAPGSEAREVNEAIDLIQRGEDLPDGLLRDPARVAEYQAPIQRRIDDLEAEADAIRQRNLEAREGSPTLGQERRMAADAERIRRLDAQISKEARRLEQVGAAAERAQSGVQAAGDRRLGNILGSGRESMERAGQLDTGLVARRKQANLKATRLEKSAAKAESNLSSKTSKVAPKAAAADGPVFYHGSGREAGRAVTGIDEWDSKFFVTHDPEIARLYGRDVREVRFGGGAKILTADTPEFTKLRKQAAKNLKGQGGLLQESNEIARLAKAAGYHVVDFRKDFIGAVVLDEGMIVSGGRALATGADLAKAAAKAPGLTAASRATIKRTAADEARTAADELKGVSRAKSAKEVARDVNRQAGKSEAVRAGQADTAKTLTAGETRRQETALQRAVRERDAATESAGARADRIKNQAAARLIKADEKRLATIKEQTDRLTDKLAEKAKLAEDDTRAIVENIAQKLPPGTKLYRESAVASLVESGADSAKAVQTAQLMNDIRAIKDTSKQAILLSADDVANGAKVPSDWVSFDLPKLGTFHAPPAVKAEVTKFMSVIGQDDAVQGFWKHLTTWDRWWKGQVTASLPGGIAFGSRNARSNVLLTFVDGMNPKYFKSGLDFQRKVSKVVKNNAAAIADEGVVPVMRRELGEREFEIWQAARANGVIGDGFYNIDLGAAPTLRAAGTAKTGGKVKRAVRFTAGSHGTLAVKGRAMNQAVEQHARMSHFLYSIDRLGDLGEAAARTNTVLFDYGRLTPFEQKVVKRILPFYTFMRKNTPGQFKALIENPARYASAEKLSQAVSAPLPEDSPEYQRRQGSHSSILPGFKGLVTTPQRPFQAAITSLEPLAQTVAAVIPGKQGPLEPEKGAPQALRSLVSQWGGGPASLTKALIEEATGKSTFTGFNLAPEEIRQRVTAAAYPAVGRTPQLTGRLPKAAVTQRTKNKAKTNLLAQIAAAIGLKMEPPTE